MFQRLNNKYFNDSLEIPVIMIQDQSSNQEGCFYLRNQWIHKDAKEINDNRNKLCISLNSRYLFRDYNSIIETLLHEMIHLLNFQVGINDCSRNGYYHNRAFRDAAESHGLSASKHEKYGWCETVMKQETIDFINQFEQFDFKYYTLPKSHKEKPASKKRVVNKLTCPTCGKFLVFTDCSSDFSISCDKCKSQLVWSFE